jgi:hypothetical protein
MMHEPGDFPSLIARDGDEQAATQIVEQYTAAVVAVTRRQIGPKLGRRVDAEIVRIQRRECALGHARELRRLLVSVTLKKVRNQASHHQVQVHKQLHRRGN